ncbi:MAG TPA: hypothetical protein VKG01_15340 [Thermoanaerobaculia bacterium]|nr:hypothetical protein [Thermoanaerobaculia bacterium]
MKTVDLLTVMVDQVLTIQTDANEDVLGYRVLIDRWKGTPVSVTY